MTPTVQSELSSLRRAGGQIPRTDLAIIQATPFCNIDCRYCYLPQRTSRNRITFETLDCISRRLFESPFVQDKLTVVWHAGEPLILPVTFYERAHKILQRWNTHGVDVTFNFQTNATLIDQEWCDFLSRPDVKVGVSLDGPKPLHDQNRMDRRGAGTFDRALRGLRLLRASGIRPSVIAVVTRESLPLAHQLWQFFEENGVGMVGLNPEEIEGLNSASSLNTPQDVVDYEEFFAQLLREMGRREGAPRLREYEQIVSLIRNESGEVHSHSSSPFAIVSFDAEGNISTFSPELLTATHAPYGDFLFGNVFSDSLESILESEKFLGVWRAIRQGVEACRVSCPFFQLCGGGAPSNKIGETGSLSATETQACRLQVKAPVRAILAHFEASGL